MRPNPALILPKSKWHHTDIYWISLMYIVHCVEHNVGCHWERNPYTQEISIARMHDFNVKIWMSVGCCYVSNFMS